MTPLQRYTLVDHDDALCAAVEALAAGTGPVAIDAERASGYRYGQRAYLIQVWREGSGTWLFDPVALPDLSLLAEVLSEPEWVLHAATQDLPCLRQVGLAPRSLFDTELSARLLGLPRVGLATVLEQHLGISLAKEHSAVDWSTRPLPTPWLDYAAADVHHLVALRDVLAADLHAQNKWDWAEQEFTALVGFMGPAPREQPWRSISGMHKVRGAKHLGALRELWLVRDALAREKDIAPGRLLPDAVLIQLALTLPASTEALNLALPNKAVRRHQRRLLLAIKEGSSSPSLESDAASPADRPPPPPRSWPEKKPHAAAVLQTTRAHLLQIAEELQVPLENLLSPDALRRVLWAEPPADPDAISEMLRARGARLWQCDLTVPIIVQAINMVTHAPESA